MYITRSFLLVFMMSMFVQNTFCVGAANADISQTDVSHSSFEQPNNSIAKDESAPVGMTQEVGENHEGSGGMIHKRSNLNEDDGVLMPYEETPVSEYEGTLFQFIQEHGDSI